MLMPAASVSVAKTTFRMPACACTPPASPYQPASPGAPHPCSNHAWHDSWHSRRAVKCRRTPRWADSPLQRHSHAGNNRHQHGNRLTALKQALDQGLPSWQKACVVRCEALDKRWHKGIFDCLRLISSASAKRGPLRQLHQCSIFTDMLQ
jgi:hypothetical protein